MDFALTDDQLSLQSAVRDLIGAKAGIDIVRAVVEQVDGDGDPPGLWDHMASQGWQAVLVPEEYEGLGLCLLDAAVVVRCLGAALVPGPYLATILGGEAIRLAGTSAQRAEWLPQLAAGTARFAVALPPTQSGSAGPPTVTADGDGRLTGTVRLVEYAHLASRIVVAAQGGDGTGLWLVDPALPGVTLTRTPVLDLTARPSTVTLDAAPAEALSDGAPGTLADLADRAAALYANDLAGVAREALTRTVSYLRTREQFGRPVGSFQALKHRLADLNVDVMMAEHAAWYAAHVLDAGLPDARLAVSIAKAKASDTARDMSATMIQYHGGIGYTWEHEAHLFYKRAKREEFAYGDATAHRERIAELVIG